MKRKPKRQELILLGLWLIIILAVVVEGIVRESRTRFSRLDDEIAVGQEKLARLNAILKQEKELNAEYDKAFSGYKPVKDSDSLLQQINAIAQKQNVNITNIKPDSAKEEAAYRYYSVRIDGQDEVYAIARFLNALTGELKSLSIERLQISAQNKDELPKVSITVNVLVFK